MVAEAPAAARRSRETWSSRAGFVLATLGCAIGVGNIWRFAYVAGENGGAAFLLVYVACVVLIGMPVMLAEFSLGNRMRSDVIAAFGARGPWRVAGAIALAAAFLILSYYAVVAGWATRYLFDYAFGAPAAESTADHARRFEAFVARPVEVALWQAVFLAATATFVAAGVQRGIERANRILMPLLALIVLVLAGYGLSLPGASGGLAFLFEPDWSALGRPGLYLAAVGQAFFSLGLGMGVLLTYASYSAERERLGSATVAIAAGDTLFAIAAGLAIFPAVYAFGMAPAQGPALAFVTLPQLFAVMPGGGAFGFAFFLLLTGAALTSAVSLVEVPVVWLMRRYTVARLTATVWVTLAAFAAGLPSAASPQVLGHIDTLTSDMLLPLASIALLTYFGWALPAQAALESAALRSPWVAQAWLIAVRYLAPAALAALLAWRTLSATP